MRPSWAAAAAVVEGGSGGPSAENWADFGCCPALSVAADTRPGDPMSTMRDEGLCTNGTGAASAASSLRFEVCAFKQCRAMQEPKAGDRRCLCTLSVPALLCRGLAGDPGLVFPLSLPSPSRRPLPPAQFEAKAMQPPGPDPPIPAGEEEAGVAEAKAEPPTAAFAVPPVAQALGSAGGSVAWTFLSSGLAILPVALSSVWTSQTVRNDVTVSVYRNAIIIIGLRRLPTVFWWAG